MSASTFFIAESRLSHRPDSAASFAAARSRLAFATSPACAVATANVINITNDKAQARTKRFSRMRRSPSPSFHNTLLRPAHQYGDQTLLEMQPVVGFLEYQRPRALQHRFADLVPPVR